MGERTVLAEPGLHAVCRNQADSHANPLRASCSMRPGYCSRPCQRLILQALLCRHELAHLCHRHQRIGELQHPAGGRKKAAASEAVVTTLWVGCQPANQQQPITRLQLNGEEQQQGTATAFWHEREAPFHRVAGGSKPCL